MNSLNDLEIEIFLDDPANIINLADEKCISGFTSNPTLLRKSGVVGYEAFAKQVLMRVTEKPVAFEVMTDDFIEMYRQAKIIQSWGKNVNVKIPITNTKGGSSIPVIIDLVNDGVTVNVTAITTLKQTMPVLEVMKNAKAGFISVFAGRIADCGISPIELMTKIVIMKDDICPQIKLIWASAREILNVVQADQCGCDIITIGSDLFKKIPLLGTDPLEMSINTVRMFALDFQSAGYKI